MFQAAFQMFGITEPNICIPKDNQETTNHWSWRLEIHVDVGVWVVVSEKRFITLCTHCSRWHRTICIHFRNPVTDPVANKIILKEVNYTVSSYPIPITDCKRYPNGPMSPCTSNGSFLDSRLSSEMHRI
jgi:hypothetical protein